MDPSRFKPFTPVPYVPPELQKGPTWEGHPDYVPEDEKDPNKGKNKGKRKGRKMRDPKKHDDSGTRDPDGAPEKEAGNRPEDEKPFKPKPRNIPTGEIPK